MRFEGLVFGRAYFRRGGGAYYRNFMVSVHSYEVLRLVCNKATTVVSSKSIGFATFTVNLNFGKHTRTA